MASSTTGQIQFLPRTYKEDQGYRDDDSEPCERSETVVFQADDSKYHVKVTFRGTIGITTRNSLLKRKKQLEALIALVDFSALPLLPDTVSELVIEKALHPSCDLRLPMKPVYQSESNDLVDVDYIYTVREDVLRVRYPVYSADSELPTIGLSEIEVKDQISNNVFLITRKGSDDPLIYKTVEHTFYEPSHTTVFQQELHYIQCLEGYPNIVQLVAVVTGPSPYTTNRFNKEHNVIHGMALEYYPHGTLEDATRQQDGKGAAWKSWASQLARALLRLHNLGITHMDITPRNVAINAANEAVFVDIGVGYTYENLAPEFRDHVYPLDLSFELRRQNDWWAFGKLLMGIASIEGDGTFGTMLQDIGHRLSLDHPRDRLDAFAALQQLPVIGHRLKDDADL